MRVLMAELSPFGGQFYSGADPGPGLAVVSVIRIYPEFQEAENPRSEIVTVSTREVKMFILANR